MGEINSCFKRNFWIKIDKIGIGKERKAGPPMEVILDDGTKTSDREEVLNKWKCDYENLYKITENNTYDERFLQRAKDHLAQYDAEIKTIDTERTNYNDSNILNSPITHDEVTKSIFRAKLCKASGIDEIPAEVLKNQGVIDYLTGLFQQCFKSGQVPTAWKQNLISPIPKGSSTNKLDPTTYRGLHLISAVCKTYCDILNIRLTTWAELNGKIVDEQNGFRKARNCLDHLFTLTTIIEDRLRRRKKLYCCFVDARKAFDKVDRNLLWSELIHKGVNGNFLQALRSLYDGYQCAIKIRGHITSWFDAPGGVKQGCLLSPILFNLYINTLGTAVRDSGIGAEYGGNTTGILLYADDVVLLADSETDLQNLLDILASWCDKW
jgi:hypothetical protein